jgi:hypothetical protein
MAVDTRRVIPRLFEKMGAGLAFYMYSLEGAEEFNTAVITDPNDVDVTAVDATTLRFVLKGPAASSPASWPRPRPTRCVSTSSEATPIEPRRATLSARALPPTDEYEPDRDGPGLADSLFPGGRPNSRGGRDGWDVRAISTTRYLQFRLRVDDDRGDVWRTLVLYRTLTSTTWLSAELAYDPDTGWAEGRVPPATGLFEYFAQAVDPSGNVTLALDHGNPFRRWTSQVIPNQVYLPLLARDYTFRDHRLFLPLILR